MKFSRLFTRTEAEQTLPLVRRIVHDILESASQARELDESDPERDEILRTIQDLFEELEEIGCFYKDWSFSVGLVDFPATIDGELVFLCWRSDEPELAWYHPIEEGYAGRRPLPPSA